MSSSASLPKPSDRSRWVVSLRGARNPVSSREPYAFLAEIEPDEAGRPALTWTVFLTNRECPWRCVMCDLWKNTLDYSTEPGAIPHQLDHALTRLGLEAAQSPRHLKLYNSGSFFDPRAIPPEDYPELIRRARSFERLIVECHPSLVGHRMVLFLEMLRSPEMGASGLVGSTVLEVALGLETVHPEALEKLNKGMTVSNFQEACHFLREQGVAIRVFLLLHPPFLPAHEQSLWLERSVQIAVQAGASVISFIPLRIDNGALGRLEVEGLAAEPSLNAIESAFESALGRPGVRVFLDLWDLERFSECSACFPARRARLETMNLEQRVLPREVCPACAAAMT